jgi:hypothetical protein
MNKSQKGILGVSLLAAALALCYIAYAPGIAASAALPPSEGSSPFLLYPTWPQYSWDGDYTDSGKDAPKGWEIESSLFDKLPTRPANLAERRVMYRLGFLTEEKDFTEEYWAWPDWVPRFEEEVISYLKNYSYHYSSVWCVGAYPKYKGVPINVSELPEGVTSVYTYGWIKAAPSYENIAGVVLTPFFPHEAEMPYDTEYEQAGAKVIQDPAEIQKVLSVEIDVEKPMAGRWIKRVKTTIHISPKIEPGVYAVGWQTSAPDKEFRQSMLWEHGLRYQDPSTGFACGTMNSLLFLVVTK